MPCLGARDQGHELKQHDERQEPDRSGVDRGRELAAPSGELDSEGAGDHGGPKDADHHPPAKRRYS